MRLLVMCCLALLMSGVAAAQNTMNLPVTPTETATPAPTATPQPTTAPDACNADGLPPDPTKPCLQLVNPLAALSKQVAQLQNSLAQVIPYAQNLERRLAQLEQAQVQPAKKGKP